MRTRPPARPHPRSPEVAASAAGPTCGRTVRRNAQERGARRPHAAVRPRLQPHSVLRVGRKPLPGADGLYFRGGVLATEDAALPAPRLLPGSDFPCRSLHPYPGGSLRLTLRSYEEPAVPPPEPCNLQGPEMRLRGVGIEPDSGR